MNRTVGLVLASLLVLGMPAPAFGAPSVAGAAGNPSAAAKILIDKVTVKGGDSACKGAAATVSPDQAAFTVTYSEFVVEAGAGAKPVDKKLCRIVIDTRAAAGYSYAILSVTFRGFALVAAGATAGERATYKMQAGAPDRFVKEHVVNGPAEKNFEFTDTIPGSEQKWSACGKERNIGITTELKVDAGSSAKTATSIAFLDSTDGEIAAASFHLAWKTCTKK